MLPFVRRSWACLVSFGLAAATPAQVLAETQGSPASKGPSPHEPASDRNSLSIDSRPAQTSKPDGYYVTPRRSAHRPVQWGSPGIVIDGVAARTGTIWGHATGGTLLSVSVQGQAPVAVGPDGHFELFVTGPIAKDLTLSGLMAQGRQVQATVPFDPCGGIELLAPDPKASYSKCVRASIGGVLEFKGLRLEVPPGALAQDTRISVRPLGVGEVAASNPDQRNVTAGADAFRLGPPGLKFQAPVLLTLPMQAKHLPAGLVLDDIYPFYYDTAKEKWTRIEKVAALSPSKLLGATTHFTDFIAASMPKPSGPGRESFGPPSPVSLKADPLAQIPMMRAPVASSSGAAQLSHPIDLPPGRAGMTPGLGFQYNSSGGNSWVGVGWDLSIPSIEIDTRFGVPLYADHEQHSYLLNGQALIPASQALLDASPWLLKASEQGKIYVLRRAPMSSIVIRRERGPFDGRSAAKTEVDPISRTRKHEKSKWEKENKNENHIVKLFGTARSESRGHRASRSQRLLSNWELLTKRCTRGFDYPRGSPPQMRPRNQLRTS